MSTYPTNPLEGPWKYDGTYQARHLSLLDLIRIAVEGSIGYDFDLLNQEATQLLIKTLLEQFAFQADALKVHVTNQIDLTTITGYLLDIKNSVAAIDTNTDGIEGLIQDTVDAINNGATSINGNLANIITELQGIDANTDGIEAELLNILNKIIAAPATEATQLLIKAKTDNLDIPLSTINASNSFEQKLLQVDTVGTTTYLGYANAGTLTSAASWAIKKIVETGSDVSITWADGNNSFDNIWDNRLALSYS